MQEVIECIVGFEDYAITEDGCVLSYMSGNARKLKHDISKVITPQCRSAAIKARTGVKHSPEIRKKISDATRGLRKTEEHQAKINASWTPEKCKQHSEKLRLAWLKRRELKDKQDG